jgi:hypothetical protein
MLEMVTVTPPPLDTVAVCGALVVPTGTDPKFSSLGDIRIGPVPLPERLTVCVPASSLMVSVPVAVPTALGVKETLMVQKAPTARLVQLLIWLNGAAVDTLDTVIGPVPELVNVTLLAALVVPTICDEKLKLVGETVAAGAVPVPVIAMICVPPRLKELSLTVNVPFTVPWAVGAKAIEAVQLDPPCRRAPAQLSVSLNPLLTASEEILSGLPPKFAMVTGRGVLGPPTFCVTAGAGGVKLTAGGSGLGNERGTAP